MKVHDTNHVDDFHDLCLVADFVADFPHAL